MFCEFKFVHYQLYFEFITPVFCTSDAFGECEPIFYLKRDFCFLFSFSFCKNMNATEHNIKAACTLSL